MILKLVFPTTGQTDDLIKQGSDIKIGGAPGAFDKEFQAMEDKLDEVRGIVNGANVTTDDIEDLKAKLGAIRRNLTENNDQMDGTETDLRVKIIFQIFFFFF
jgi:hypothetical protein